MIVRRARVDDAAAAARLVADVAAEERWIGTEPPVDEEAWAARFRDTVAAGTDVVLVAEAGRDLVGNLGLHFHRIGPPTLGMSVAREWRGRGVGARLVEAAIEAAHAAGAYKIALEVFPHNEAALALYRKFGFVEEGRLRKHYRRRNGVLWDAVVMGLVLDP